MRSLNLWTALSVIILTLGLLSGCSGGDGPTPYDGPAELNLAPTFKDGSAPFFVGMEEDIQKHRIEPGEEIVITEVWIPRQPAGVKSKCSWVMQPNAIGQTKGSPSELGNSSTFTTQMTGTYTCTVNADAPDGRKWQKRIIIEVEAGKGFQASE